MRLRIPLLVVCLLIASGFALLTRAIMTGDSDARQAGQANLWPAFEMEYVYQVFDPRTGALIADETHRLTVTSEWQWRDEIVRDEVDPRRAGSYREFRGGGVYYSYKANLGDLKELPVDEDSILLVSQFLDPTLFAKVKSQKSGPGWVLESETAAVTTAVQRTARQCPGPQGPAECGEEFSVKWETASDMSFRGGIPTNAHRSVDGRLVENFVV